MSKRHRSGGLFNRNKPDASAPETADNQEQTSAQPARRNRTEEPLLHETVWETTVDICNANPLFIVTRDDERFFVGLYMPFSEIGGLSKKDAKQESKGQIVGQINHGQISVMNTAALIEKEAVVFLPTESTVTNMSDFSLLGDTANYEYCFINADTGELELTGVKTKLAGVQSLHLDNKSVATIPALRKMVDGVPDVTSQGQSSGGVKAVSVPMAASVSQNVDVEVPQEMQELGYHGEDEDEDDDRSIGEEDVPTGGDAQYGASADDEFSDDEDDGGTMSEEEAQAPAQDSADDEFSDELDDLGSADDAVSPDVQFTAEDTQQVLHRRFFNDTVEEELTTAPLDQALADAIPYRPIPYRPNGWLNEQINSRLGVMNQELNQLHQSNLAQVRQRYLDGMVQLYMDAMNAVNSFEESEEYKDLKQKTDNYLESSTAEVEKRRTALKEEFEQQAKAAGEQARSEAEQRYRDRYHWELEQRLSSVEGEVFGGIQASFQMLVDRRKQAIRQDKMAELDKKCQELVDACCKQFADLSEDEEKLRKVHEDDIQRFLEENRKDEVARTQALLEEQSRDDRVARIQKEYDGHVAELKKEFDALSEAHKRNLQTLREHHADELTAQENVHRRDVAIYASDNQRQQSRIDQLTESLTQLDEKKKQEYAAKISELEAQRDAVEAKYQDAIKSQSRGNKLMIAIAAITAMFCLVAGVLIGQFVMSNLSAEKELIDDLHSQYVQTVDGQPQTLPDDEGGGVNKTESVDETTPESGEPEAPETPAGEEPAGETEPAGGETTPAA